MSVRRPWVADEERNACRWCGELFSLLKRRHHCRNCGEIFCARCSQNSSNALPGYQKSERVCDPCYFGGISYLVVWRARFGGVAHCFRGSVQDGQTKYEQLRRNNRSALLLPMATGVPHSEHFENDRWRERLALAAGGIRRRALPNTELLRREREPTTPPLYSTTCLLLASQSGGVWDVSPISPAVTADRAGAEATLAQIPAEVTEAAVFTPDGALLGTRKRRLFRLQSTLESEAVTAFQQCPAFIAWHAHGDFDSRLCANIPAALQELGTLPREDSAVVALPSSVVVAERNCGNLSWRAGFARHVGAAALRSFYAPPSAVLVAAAGQTEPAPTRVGNLVDGLRALQGARHHRLFAMRDGAPALVATAALCPAAADRTVAAPHLEAVVAAFGPAEAADRPGLLEVTCDVCFEVMDPALRRPVLCRSCGNSTCAECYSTLEQCPMCRDSFEKDRPPLYDVKLTHTLEAGTPPAGPFAP